jgi:localization factor PodJL
MRPDIPWNVAGIPQEAREAARAAARREGLSIGEWMTRRILRSFSDNMEAAPMREAWASNISNFSPAPEVRPSRRDTEEMLAHVARSENESSEVFRRIEQQLRGVARRLEATERSQSENNRAMTQAASEINVTAREQAQAFDQLGNSVISLADRLDRVERLSANEGLREAVKGLHQGLSRLADQISTTANQSASQISALADNLESVAGRLAQVRGEAETKNQLVEQRFAQIDERMHGFEQQAQAGQTAIEQTLAGLHARTENEAAADRREAEATNEIVEQRFAQIDERMRGFEQQAQAGQAVIEQTFAGLQAHKDEASAQRDAETASAIARLEAGLSKLESRGADPELDHRLSGIERTLSEIASRLEQPDTTATKVADELKRLAQRVDATEVNQRDSVLELRAALTSATAHATRVEVPPSIDGSPIVPPPAAAFEAPPLADEPVDEQLPPHTESTDAFAPALDIAALPMHDATAEAPVADVDDAQPEVHTEPFASDEVAPPAAESYLSAARRSARAAAAHTESEIGSRVGGFSWGASASVSSDEAKPDPRKTYVVVGIIALVLILAIAAGAFLSQRISSTSPRSAAPLFRAQRPVVSGPAHARAAVPVLNTIVVPPTGQAAPVSPTIDTHAVPPAPTQGATAPGARVAAITPLDKLTALANSGNAKAELIVGLKYLDGDGVAVNEADAAKWLDRAAVAGLPLAQYRLGTLYERGRGVAADPVKSVHWYTLAAQAGNRKAMHNLAVAYASGTGAPKNMAEAARWFSKAAALGLSDSQFNLAVLYERGFGVPQSLVDAYKWYAIAATSGDTESKARIDALATQLSAEDRAAAQRSVAAFRAEPLDPKANVAPQLSDIAN